MTYIQTHISQVNELCKEFNVKELYAFGSVLDESRFSESSDIDMIVKFQENIPIENYFDLYFDLADKLEHIFNRKVDLMIAKEIRNIYLRKSIEATKQLIYAA
ncbi:MAG: nucleotidyltransferase [Bacteroidetes bacterium]|jgi:predicted nucleotidyltransferase|nr:nucleotidyltransferase [Bacteroidota bacterium]